jgi:two-component system, chemotaxis family, sensor kinase CheA
MSTNKEQEYKEMFLAEALENFEQINKLLTVLEKNPEDKNTIHSLFRITHTLKGNAAGMGFSSITEMSHVLEDLFAEVREGRLGLDATLFSSLFKAADVLGKLIEAIKDNSDVKYKGIKTKLEVLINRSRQNTQAAVISVGESASLSVDSDLTGDDAQSGSEPAVSVEEETNKIAFSDLVQVPVRKLDNLLNLVGELMIEKDRILSSQQKNGIHAANEFSRLSRISSDLQYSVMDVRLVQVGFLFNRFFRVVRDAASLEEKKVALKLEGTDTEIDRNVLQVISDSLIHIIRNCVGHGIERPEERIKAGKPEEGVITLRASSETDSVIIEISDDGRGLNYDRIKQKAISKGLITTDDAERLSREDLSMIIFEPGFSTMDHVTAISGRGVGMDVVKKTLDGIGGTIRVASSEGKGTVIQLTLPSSMAVKSSLLLEMDQHVYAIPLAYTQSVISLYKQDIRKAGGGLIASHLGKNFTVVFLRDLFDQGVEREQGMNFLQRSFELVEHGKKLEIVVVHFNNRTVGIVVDKLLQQKEIVEKPLMRPLDKVRFISGVTILGTGNVCLVLNIPFLLQHIFSVSAGNKQTWSFNLN